MALDFESVVSVDDTVVAAMVEAGDTSDVAVDENSTMTVEVVDNGSVKRKRGCPRKNLEVVTYAAPVKKLLNICDTRAQLLIAKNVSLTKENMFV